MLIKDIKLFVYSVTFVICYSCVLCQKSYSIPEPLVELLRPKGFRITIAGLNIRDLIRPAAYVSVFNEVKDRKNPFVANFTRTGNRWVYENTHITILPGQTLSFTVWIHTKDGGYNLREEPYEFVVPSTLQQSHTSRQLPIDSDVSNNLGNSRPRLECELSKTTVQGRKVCQGELIFQDDFDFLNDTIWSRDVRIPLDIDDADFVVYRDDPETLNIYNSQMYMTPFKLEELPGFDEATLRRGELDLGTKCTGIVDRASECKRQAGFFRILPPVVSARINTKKSFSFRYGKIEVRAKLPKGDWIFPLIALDPLTSEYGISGYASGQMRVAFIRGNEQLKTKEGWAIDGSYLSGGVVLKSGEEDRDKWLKTVRGKEHWGNTVHTYTLTWTDSEISLAYDGNTYATISGGFNHPSGSHIAPFDKEFYISFGVSAGGVSDFPDGSVSNNVPKPWQNTNPKAELHFWNARNEWGPTWDTKSIWLIIDRVRVWAL